MGGLVIGDWWIGDWWIGDWWIGDWWGEKSKHLWSVIA